MAHFAGWLYSGCSRSLYAFIMQSEAWWCSAGATLRGIGLYETASMSRNLYGSGSCLFTLKVSFVVLQRCTSMSYPCWFEHPLSLHIEWLLLHPCVAGQAFYLTTIFLPLTI